MDSESETNPSWWYDYEPFINMTEDLNDEQSGNNETQIIEAHDEALNAVPAMGW
ncbi:hypothetical protein RchiOBHm_Chr7g0203721 [Rosa chinensis]|uniref:Uncharacterized protein n=1 Tax=Rosa chinensis TaxID=74649 RepID=A0A2P6P8I4_ROSCH|nr:hypothetical protein RchiOBHm_Chr7g0203721 [Rosa chinensis]